MSDLIQKLGIDWKLLASQAVNFLILLVVLRKFAYTPLLKILKERRARIEEGIAKASEADHRLEEANAMAKDKMKQTEEDAMAMMRTMEEKAKKTEALMLEEAHKKEAQVLLNAQHMAEIKSQEAAKQVRAEAVAVIKQALIKAVGMAPESVDESLVTKAVEEVTRHA
jgi:F-type H+-transporting ATPase subunit b